jgi:hypothetical protein
MVVPPNLTHASPTVESGQKKAEPSQALLLFAFIAGAGIATALAATTASGPFAGMRPVAHRSSAPAHLVKTTVPFTQIDASVLFPAPAPPATVQQVVHVYDLPAPAPSTAKAGKTEKEHKSHPQSTPEPAEHSSAPPQDHHAPPTPEPSGDPVPHN